MNRTRSTRGYDYLDQTKLRGNLNNISPSLKSVVRNLVRDERDHTRNTDEKERKVQPSKLKKISDIIASNINAATDLREITPYVSRAELIWKTLLLYPNGLQERILTHDTLRSQFKNTKLHEELLRKTETYYTSDYKIEKLLPEFIKDGLFGTGSYVLLNISRPALDHLINGQQFGEDGVTGNESYINTQIKPEIEKQFKNVDGKFLAINKGLVRGPKQLNNVVHGLEALFSHSTPDASTEFELIENDEGEGFGITLTDNPAVLALRSVNQVLTKKIVNDIGGTEDLASLIKSRLEKKGEVEEEETTATKDKKKEDPKKSNKEPDDTKAKRKNGTPNADTKTQILSESQLEVLQNEFYPHRSYPHRQTISVRSPGVYDTSVYGIPLRYHIPSEAFIPVHMEGDRTKLIGGFALLDPSNGEFLKSTRDFNFYQSSKGQKDKIDTPNKTGGTNALIANLKKVQQGADCDFDMSEFTLLSKDQIEKSLIQAIASGVSGKNISVELVEANLKIFLARSFKQQGVRVLYIPAEYFTYVAFDYNSFGIGSSLTNQAKLHIGRLAALDTADILANLDQAQTRQRLVVDLEEDDVDPDGTIATARAQFFRVNPTLHNVVNSGTVSVPDIVEAMKTQSLIVEVNSNGNPWMVGPKITLEPVERGNFKAIDETSRQNLLNNIASTFKLQRTWLDDKEEGTNFQVEALAEQEMLRNQTLIWQKVLGDFVAEIERKDMLVNQVMLNRLVDTINENKSLWKPDNGEEIEGTNEHIVEVILADFINNLTVTLPTPATQESVTKLKDKIDTVNQFVNSWVEMSGTSGLIEMIMNKVDANGGLDIEKAKSIIRSTYLIELYDRFNLPMPFDLIGNKGKEGGIYSLIHNISQYVDNSGMFLEQFMKVWNKETDRLTKRLEKIMPAEQPPADEFGTPPADEGNPEEGTQTDDDFSIEEDLPGEGGTTEEEETGTDTSEEEENQTEEETKTEEDGDKKDDFQVDDSIPE